MAQAYTYDDGAVKEDLLDVLTNISPTETQFITGVGQSRASATLHEWLEDELGDVKVNAYVEGVDASYPTLTNPTRLTNWTQIFRQGFQVTDTERTVNTAAFNDRYTYEATKALRMLKNDMEFASIRGTIATGSSSTVRSMKGVKAWLSIASSQSGVSLSETMLNDYFQLVWEAGTEVNTIYAPARLKRRISGFSGAATEKNVNVNDKRLVNSVEIYESDVASMVKLFKHRYVTISGDTNYDLIGVNEDLFRMAYLRNPQERELAKTGDSTKGEIVAEATVECLSGNGGFVVKEVL